MTQDEEIQLLKAKHDKLQEGIPSNMMAIREGIVVEVGNGAYDSYPRFSYQFFSFRNPECVREMDLFVKYAKGKKCFFDVGAYLGIFSLVFSELNPDGITHAFEPEMENFVKLLVYTSNRKIICHNDFLSDKNGMCTAKKIFEDQYQIVDDKEDGLIFMAYSGDDIVEDIPDVIKVDTEGSELKVLKGFSKTIAKHHPLIFLELHLRQLSDEDLNQIIHFIEDHKYTVINSQNDLPMPSWEIAKQPKGEFRIILK